MSTCQRNRAGRIPTADSDLRLSDFADGSLPSTEHNRISKKVINRHLKDWFDCELEEFDEESDTEVDKNDSDDNVVNVSTVAVTTPRKVKRKRRKCKPFTKDESYDEIDWIQYPNDLWYLIAKYIDPEDVGRFAAINLITRNITKSAAFWKKMYERFYRSSIELPERLRPESIFRLYGLRTCVVKSLFYCYPPFVQRSKVLPGVQLKSSSIFRLCRSLCTNVWHEQQDQEIPEAKRDCTFYFQFSPIDSKRYTIQSNEKTVKDKLSYLDDVWANKQSNNCVLKVCTNRYTHFPVVLGWRLSEISISLGPDLRTHRLKLEFQSFAGKKSSGSATLGTSVLLVIDEVQRITMLDWWQTDYPLAVV